MKKMVSMGIVSLLVIGGFLGIMNLMSEYASAYTTHDPIYIDENSQFIAANGVTSGNGTQGNPYIIKGWDINASSANGIEIHNTDAYFIIRDCYVHDGYYSDNDGICFYNVQNGVVENTSSLNNGHGIVLGDSGNNNIFNNSLYSNSISGIYMFYSSYNDIFNNNASNNGRGIWLYHSSDNDIYNNRANSNTYYGINPAFSSDNNIYNNSASNNGRGIYMDYSSNNNNISNNSVSNNNYGIQLVSSSYNNIYNNSDSNNNHGICLGSSSYNSFVSNNISYNSYSVKIHNISCENNTFHHNNFISGSVVNVIDSGANTTWDDGYGEGNYWSNYTGLDDGSDGRVAGDGIGDTNIPHMGLDNFPLMNPVKQPYTPPDTTPPVISSVNVSEIAETSAIITWTTDEYSDSRVNYSVNADLTSNSTKYNSTLTTNHPITLTGLSPNTTYYFEVTSADKRGNTATDTNNSNYYRFTTLEDTIPPTISDVTAIPDPQEIYGYVNISADVSDNAYVDTVCVNITDPNGMTVGNFTMTHDLVNDRYYKNQTYDIVGTYQFIIWADDTSNNWNFSSGQFTMQDTPPATPTSLTVTDVPNDEGGALNITWDANTEPDLDHYTLYSNKTGSWAVVAEIPAGTEYYVDTGLTDGARYYYNISASDNALNESPQSATASGVPMDNPPAAPTGLTAQDHPNDEGGAIDLDWNDNTEPDLDHYDVYRSTTMGGPYTWLSETTVSEYTDSTTTDGITYYYVVTASDEVPNESGYSNEASASSIDDLPPAAPTGLTVADHPNDEGGAIDLNWNDNTEPDLDHYDVYRSTASGEPYTWLVETIVSEYTDSTTTDGVTYHYVVTASDGVPNESGYSNEASANSLDNLPPATPIGLMVTDVPNDEGGALNITWNANTEPDLDHYTLYSNKTDSWAVVAEIPAGTEYYVDTGLTDGTGYYYNISASDNASNESPLSDAAYGIPADNLPPAIPTGLTVTSLRSGDLNITWNLNTDDTQIYSIYSNKTGTWRLITNVTHPQHWYVDTGLTNERTYYYRISAWDEVPLESLKSEAVHGVSSLIGTISGTVKDKEGTPIEGVNIVIYVAGTTDNPVSSTITNSNGEYSIDVPPGTYDVKIGKSGYDVQWKKDVEVTADQTTTSDATLPLKTDILSEYWWLILPIVIVIVIIIAIVFIVKKKKPIEEVEEEAGKGVSEEELEEK